MSMDWDKLRVFHAVATAGSFTRATDILHISQSAISRQVSILEDELSTPLFIRLSRGLELTDAGKKLHTVVTDVFGKVAMTEAAISEVKNYPRGKIKVATTLAFGSLWLAPRLKEFMDRYPEIQLDLLLKDEEVDLNMREADIGITSENIQNPDIIVSEPISYQFRIYAGRGYLKKHGVPTSLDDLDKHQLIVYGKEMPHIYSNLDWLLTLGAKKTRVPFLIASSAQAILEGVRKDMGIAALHKYIVGDDPNIVEILPNSPGSNVHRYIVYPRTLERVKRVQVFVDYLIEKMLEEEF